MTTCSPPSISFHDSHHDGVRSLLLLWRCFLVISSYTTAALGAGSGLDHGWPSLDIFICGIYGYLGAKFSGGVLGFYILFFNSEWDTLSLSSIVSAWAFFFFALGTAKGASMCRDGVGS